MQSKNYATPTRRENSSIGEKLRQAMKEPAQEEETKSNEKPYEWKANPYVKAAVCITGVIIIVWASQYAFAAFEGTIRQFKKLRKTMREK